MAKKRSDEDIWGENEPWGDEDESWEYKPSGTPGRAARKADNPFGGHNSRTGRETAGRAADGSPRRETRREDDAPFFDSAPPSRAAGRPIDNRARTASQRRDYAERHNPRYRDEPPAPQRSARAPQKKSKIVYFYIGTLLIAVAACLVLFAMAFQTITKDNNPIVAAPADAPDASQSALAGDNPTGDMLESRNTRQFVGMITGLAYDPNKITVLDINTNRSVSYDVLDNTNIKDRFGTALSISELREGMIIDVGYHSQTAALVSLEESTQALKLDYRTNAEINLETSSITLGNDTYTYNSDTIVQSNGEDYPISQITPMDTVSLMVYGKTAWSVRLEGSHGFLTVESADKVVGGVLSVGNSIFMSLTDITEPLPLAEGTHAVLVEGENIEPFMQTVAIGPGETVNINLIDVELKPGSLLVTVSEPDSEIIIDGTPLAEPGLVELSFGEHVVRVEKDGFLPMEQAVEINKAYTELSIELTKLILNAKLIINTIPSPAEVYLDNVFMGHTPWTQDVQVGTHTVTVRLYGYYDSTITFDVVEGENRRDLILSQTSSDPFDNLPPPDNTQPIVNEMIEDPVYPDMPGTATPTPSPNPDAQRVTPNPPALTPNPPVTTPSPPSESTPVTDFPTPVPTSSGQIFEEIIP